jgi:asparagine synthase (glutamine-hydrolysing)
MKMLSEKALEKSGLFDPAKVGKLVKLLQGPRAGSEVNNMALVGILSAQLVHKRFVDSFPKTPAVSVPPDLVFDRRSTASN